ncbi:hypothetical protein CAI21_20935 [Alkalilimnicola ehrlichii]|uniref:HAMP domain-containing protein n=1 Tax=Alkalilimnicola ehrlichii TaxID=351052 RepID=A0A3E0WFL8_9GAMM|nr:methyl-accepting chemotaxis protein [Alkalilimnicola ehrlichii]RFA24621.1 hypothetical protein CAI21_20935 [Alkalilimnicola ehrlichii]RFA31732.1 hypothetical protein CAL65_21615 [Alkalilimnicola ehrlichii]
MSVLARIPLLWKVLLAPTVSAVCFLGFLAYAMYVFGQNNLRMEGLRDVTFPALEVATENVGLLDRLTETLHNAVASGEPALIDDSEALAEQTRANWSRLAQLDGAYAQQASGLRRNFDAYYEAASEVSQAMVAGRAPAGGAIERMAERLDSYRDGLNAFRADTHDSFTSEVEHSTAASNRARAVGVLIAVISLAVSLLIGFAVALAVKRNVDQVVGSLRDIAQGEGDLRQRIRVTSQDEIGTLAYWFNIFVEKLHLDIQKLLQSVRALSKTSRDMSAIVANTDRAIAEEKRVIAQVAEQAAGLGEQVNQIASSPPRLRRRPAMLPVRPTRVWPILEVP